ncbi:hypothetical protein LEP1GSC192_2026 [Leptospira sp. B5-022]|nr:hypothetical protein LEP1GSC192_2026 [Leptospira sp. B5-022]
MQFSSPTFKTVPSSISARNRQTFLSERFSSSFWSVGESVPVFTEHERRRTAKEKRNIRLIKTRRKS